ncbi:hypothetical protein ACVJGB_003288 [Bradyrhizobium liaoningense]
MENASRLGRFRLAWRSSHAAQPLARDLGRNNPIAAGAKQTSKNNVVGSGLRVRSKLNPKLVGLSPETAEL